VVGGMLLVSGLVLFARPVYVWVAGQLGANRFFPSGTAIVFWTVFGILVLAPLVGIWRNVGVLSMIVAEWATRDSRRGGTLQPLIERALRGASAILLLTWLLALMPFRRGLVPAFAVVLTAMALTAALLWRRLVYWQSRLEIELRSQLQSAMGSQSTQDLQQLLEEKKDAWQLQAEEYVLPEFSAAAGKRIGELALRRRLGCSVASIDRHGVLIVNPAADFALYPRDKLLLLGSPEQIDRAMAELGTAAERAGEDIEEFSLETLSVPDQSPLAGKSLHELDLFRTVGVQVTGILRGSNRILTPGGRDQIEVRDELLVLGTAKQIGEFEEWLNGNTPAGKEDEAEMRGQGPIRST